MSWDSQVASFDVELPADATPHDAARAVDQVVARHQGLRSTITAHPDGPRQQLHPMVEGTVTALSRPPDAEARQPMQLASQWPVAAYAWRDQDGGTRLQVQVHRCLIDHDSAELLRAELAQAVLGQPLDQPARQPLGVAGYESSAAAQQRSQASHDYWLSCLRAAPAQLFTSGRPPQPDDQRFRITSRSAAARTLTRQLAADCRVTESMVLMALSVLALSMAAGSSELAVSVITANRIRPESRGALLAMTGRGVLGLRVDPEQSFQSWTRLVGARTLEAYRHAYADPNAMYRAVARATIERGGQLQRLPILNVLTGRAHLPDGPDGELSTVRQPGGLDGSYLRVRLAPEAVELELLGGEQALSLTDGEAVPRHLFDLLNAAGQTGVGVGLGALCAMLPSAGCWSARPAPERPAELPVAIRPGTAAAHDLVAAIVAAHSELDPADVDLALPYTVTGGRIEQIPLVLAALRSAGRPLPSISALLGADPLISLAET
ncbi:MAG: condensation domain-containing protein [Jatrophihabitans sp.]